MLKISYLKYLYKPPVQEVFRWEIICYSASILALVMCYSYGFGLSDLTFAMASFHVVVPSN